jgi:hypothetical protein
VPQRNERIGRAQAQCPAPYPLFEAALGVRQAIATTASRSPWDKIPRAEMRTYIIYVMRWLSMATAKCKSNSAWQAEVNWKPRYVPMKAETTEGGLEKTTDGEVVRRPPTTRWRLAEDGEEVDMWLRVCDCSVDVFRPGGERIRFGVNRPNDRHLTFTDPRDRTAGTAGTTGIWGTRPALRAARPRTLTPTGFKAEVARLIGAERADEIVRALLK